MYEYKIEYVHGNEEAELIMNRMAERGWRVVSTTFWNGQNYGLLITFEREKTAVAPVKAASPAYRSDGKEPKQVAEALPSENSLDFAHEENPQEKIAALEKENRELKNSCSSAGKSATAAVIFALMALGFLLGGITSGIVISPGYFFWVIPFFPFALFAILCSVKGARISAKNVACEQKIINNQKEINALKAAMTKNGYQEGF